jgi:DNA polymerase-3 subunit epsilon
MNYLFVDTETTGKADLDGDCAAPHQPRIVQITAALVGEANETIGLLSSNIMPEGWTVPADVAEIHGVTTEIAHATGIPIRSALSVFNWFAKSASVIVAYNKDFDLFLLSGEFKRIKQPSAISEREEFCLMQAMTPICNLPPKPGYSTPKWPKLSEAYFHAFGNLPAESHSSLADVETTRAVYWWWRKECNGGKPKC